jgi:mono/diheme cytochrome c family protein
VAEDKRGPHQRRSSRRQTRREMTSDAPNKTVNQTGPEPVAERWAIPMWQIIALALLIYGGALFMAENAGGFASDVYNPYRSSESVAAANPQDPEAKKRAEGRKIFEGTCAACHQLSGMGQEGKAPPLVGSEWVLAAGGNRIAHVVLNGLTGPISVKGNQWNLTMVPWRDNFTDDQIAAVLTFVRSSWGNNAAPINPDLIKTARADKHPGPMSSDELLKMPVQ